MAERRMFAKTIIDSDAFIDMPLSTQALYFHLSMRADDEGFINNPKKIQRMIGASDDDLKLLIAKRFVLTFDSGVIVIKHWKIHNYIQKDRFKQTLYQEEKSILNLKENGSYTFEEPEEKIALDTSCIQNGYTGKVSIGKSSIGKISIDENKLLLDEFEKLWKLYPKKVGKDKSFDKYKKYRTSKKQDEYVTFDEVLNGLMKYLKYAEQNTWYHPKDGTTWFNNRGWADEYTIKEPEACLQIGKREEMSEEELAEMQSMFADFKG